MKNIYKGLKNHLINIPGATTKRKIVVIESDDWGSIRTPSNDDFKHYKKYFSNIENPYLKYDTLASKKDLTAIFDVLNGYKDKHGNHPIITFNTVVANPNFDKIKSLNFSEYYYEYFTETLKRYYPNENVFDLWNVGIKEGFIFPQFHGREHVNVPVWLNLLQSGNKEIINAFEFGTWSTPKGKYPPIEVKLQASLDFIGEQPSKYQEAFIIEGLDVFEKIFGFRSETMIANNFILPTNLHAIIKKSNVRMIQGMKYQVQPYGTNSKRSYIRRYFGNFDDDGLFFNIRNCSFEPSQTKDSFDDVGNCLKEIQNAFFWNKPAVISSHRLNFIGSIEEKNRTKNLEKLNLLLTEIIKRWPNVEFVSSDKLIDIV